jgi:tetrahydromethanopterin S-methyltransferase subunit G
MENPIQTQDVVTLKEFLLGIINDYDRKAEVRFNSIDKRLEDVTQTIKELLQTTVMNTKEVLETATNHTRDALASANASIAAMGINVETRVNMALAASKEAILKAETAVEKRFDALNEFRAQSAEQQATFVRKAEVDIRFDALEKKLDAAVAMLQHSKGKEVGSSTVWGIVIAVCGLLIAVGTAIVIAVTAAKGH